MNKIKLFAGALTFLTTMAPPIHVYAAAVSQAVSNAAEKNVDLDKSVNLQNSINLTDEIAKENQDSNVMFSPTSLNFALGMLAEGAEGETKNALNEYLGTDDFADAMLPMRVKKIHRIQNQAELAKLYLRGDVLVNPTREEIFGMVNIEANACGTPVVTFNTGGSPECIGEQGGIVVEKDNVNEMCKAIISVCETKCFSKKMCVKQAAKFEQEKKYAEYIGGMERKRI